MLSFCSFALYKRVEWLSGLWKHLPGASMFCRLMLSKKSDGSNTPHALLDGKTNGLNSSNNIWGTLVLPLLLDGLKPLILLLNGVYGHHQIANKDCSIN